MVPVEPVELPFVPKKPGQNPLRPVETLDDGGIHQRFLDNTSGLQQVILGGSYQDGYLVHNHA